jgi:hypothetical protein
VASVTVPADRQAQEAHYVQGWRFDTEAIRRMANARPESQAALRPALLDACDLIDRLAAALAEAERERDGLRSKLARAAYCAEHLMQMIDRETWRAHGGDDGQGHYEGDYHEAQMALEVKEWAALAVVRVPPEPPETSE